MKMQDYISVIVIVVGFALLAARLEIWNPRYAPKDAVDDRNKIRVEFSERASALEARVKQLEHEKVRPADVLAEVEARLQIQPADVLEEVRALRKAIAELATEKGTSND